jgi:hypothetical protein
LAISLSRFFILKIIMSISTLFQVFFFKYFCPPLNGNLNKGECKKLENMWRKQREKGKPVEVKIKPVYKGEPQRPVSFDIEYKIGEDNWQYKEFQNKHGG